MIVAELARVAWMQAQPMRDSILAQWLFSHQLQTKAVRYHEHDRTNSYHYIAVQ